MAQPIGYDLVSEFWEDGGTVRVRDCTKQEIVDVPLEFLSKGGVANWQYIHEVITHCVEDSGILLDGKGQPVNLESAVTRGHYTYVRKDDPAMPLTLRRGPESKTPGRAPQPGTSDTTYSDSARSSIHQSKFKLYLIYRDGDCLLTDVSFALCTAAHIVPVSRSALYSAILGKDVGNVNAPHMGLLLRDDVHHSHDRGDWALYCKDDTYVVHFFVPGDPTYRDLHGKVLNPERFRGPADLRPNKQLLEWHYRQCAMMHFRGYSVRMTAADAIATVSREGDHI